MARLRVMMVIANLWCDLMKSSKDLSNYYRKSIRYTWNLSIMCFISVLHWKTYVQTSISNINEWQTSVLTRSCVLYRKKMSDVHSKMFHHAINGHFVASFVIAFQVCSQIHMRTVERSLFCAVPMNAARIPNWFMCMAKKLMRKTANNTFVQSCTKNESLHVIKNLTATTTTTTTAKVVFIYCTKKTGLMCALRIFKFRGFYFRSIRIWHCHYVDVDIVCFRVAIFRTNTKHTNV